MIAKATLVAGPRHARYESGKSVPALLFFWVATEEEAEGIASRELAALGWSTMAIEKYKHVSDLEQFENSESPEAAAARAAQLSGFEVVVYP